jgi:hypothetical protein
MCIACFAVTIDYPAIEAGWIFVGAAIRSRVRRMSDPEGRAVPPSGDSKVIAPQLRTMLTQVDR